MESVNRKQTVAFNEISLSFPLYEESPNQPVSETAQGEQIQISNSNFKFK